MRTLLSIFAFVLCSISFGQEIKWLNVEEAEAAIKANPKKQILLNLYTDWCGYCKRMNKETFVDADIVKYINDNYIPVKFNAETNAKVSFLGINYSYIEPARANYLAFVMTGGRLSYPATVVLDDKGIAEKLIFGYRSVEDFKQDIKI